MECVHADYIVDEGGRWGEGQGAGGEVLALVGDAHLTYSPFVCVIIYGTIPKLLFNAYLDL